MYTCNRLQCFCRRLHFERENMRNKIKLIISLIVIALLVTLCFAMVRSLIGFLNQSDLNASEPDPMFAEETETVTRPPDLYAEEEQKEHLTLDDYVPEVETPVDKTVDELIREAQANS